MKGKTPGLLVLALIIAVPATMAQDDSDRWERAITSFEIHDMADYPPPGASVFIGSSSIRGWRTLESDLAPWPVVNRGFGGSQMADAARYIDRVVIQYRPNRVFVYEGDNDIWAGKSAETVLEDARLLVREVHDKLDHVPVCFLSVKPSPSRWEKWPEMRKANRLLRELAERNPDVFFVDVATPLLGADGAPREELFVEDMLHLNPKGYEAWTAAVRPLLEKSSAQWE